jgi:dihydroneopterin triphosphate diphosphatase
MRHKQPRSVQVVIFAETDRGREFLLLRRVSNHGGFWQSVTGSLEDGETHREAAVREVLEETGITVRPEDLIDLDLLNTFEIAPQWRTRYAPGVSHNEEVCFAIEIGKCSVQVDAIEHDAWLWAGYDQAMEMLHWQSSISALARLEASVTG